MNELSPILATAKASPPALEDVRVGIVGLGYVGLPLAVDMAPPISGHGLRREQGAR